MASLSQAVILAGGLGTRLRPITETVPKCLVEVNGKPFLHYLLTHLASVGFQQALLLVGYKGEQVSQYVKDGSAWSLRVSCIQEPVLLGTGGALKHAQSSLAESFAVVNGDTILPVDYQAPIAWLSEKQADGVLVVCRTGQEGLMVAPNVSLDEKGRVVRYQKGGATPDLQYVDGGVGFFRKGVVLDIGDGPSSLEETVYQSSIARGTLYGWDSPKRFYDMGTPAQLKELEQVLP